MYSKTRTTFGFQKERSAGIVSTSAITPSSAACLITKSRNTHFHYSLSLRTGKLFLFLQTFFFLFSAVLLFFFLSLTSRCRAPNASIRACTHNEPANKKRRERQWQRLISQFRIDAVSCTLALSLFILCFLVSFCSLPLLFSLPLPQNTMNSTIALLGSITATDVRVGKKLKDRECSESTASVGCT